MYTNSIRIKDISTHVGMSIGGIVKCLERNNIPRRKPISKQRTTKLDYDVIVQMVKDGKSDAEIAITFNTNYKYIWKYRKQKNIIRSPRQTHNKCENVRRTILKQKYRYRG